MNIDVNKLKKNEIDLFKNQSESVHKAISQIK